MSPPHTIYIHNRVARDTPITRFPQLLRQGQHSFPQSLLFLQLLPSHSALSQRAPTVRSPALGPTPHLCRWVRLSLFFPLLLMHPPLIRLAQTRHLPHQCTRLTSHSSRAGHVHLPRALLPSRHPCSLNTARRNRVNGQPACHRGADPVPLPLAVH